jgi:hypothetical protein
MSHDTRRESSIERVLREGVEKLGGKAYKFVSPGEAGVADRVIVLPFIPVWFVECKAEHKPLEPLQILFRDFVTERGHQHATLDSIAKVSNWLAARHRDIMRAKALR